MKTRVPLLLALTLSLLAAPLAAEAQQAGKIYRVGVIASTTSVAELAQHSGVGAFVQRLRELGWNEGRNIVIERRTSEGKTERFAPLTAEFVALGVDVIVLVSQAGAVAARRVTATTPIVMVTSARPVEAELAASLARPGGNVTGHTIFAEPQEEGKRLQLLKEAVPRASRIVYLGPEWVWATDYGQEARNAARVLGLTLTFLPARERAQFPGGVRDDAPQASRRTLRLRQHRELRLPAAHPRLRDPGASAGALCLP